MELVDLIFHPDVCVSNDSALKSDLYIYLKWIYD